MMPNYLMIYFFQMTGNTPLMLAVKDNKTPLIDRLVDLGSDVCARNNVSQVICQHDSCLTWNFHKKVMKSFSICFTS